MRPHWPHRRPPHKQGRIPLGWRARAANEQPRSDIAAALLVAPADPAKFGVCSLLPTSALPVPSTLVGSETDPWMSAAEARRWARRWASHWVNLGPAGHINAEAGFGPLPLARRWAMAARQRIERGQGAAAGAAAPAASPLI